MRPEGPRHHTGRLGQRSLITGQTITQETYFRIGQATKAFRIRKVKISIIPKYLTRGNREEILLSCPFIHKPGVIRGVTHLLAIDTIILIFINHVHIRRCFFPGLISRHETPQSVAPVRITHINRPDPFLKTPRRKIFVRKTNAMGLTRFRVCPKQISLWRPLTFLFKCTQISAFQRQRKLET